MFNTKKPSGSQSKERRDLSQYGLFDIPDDIVLGGNDNDALSEDDSDLEAELAAITGGGKKRQKTKAKPAAVPQADLDAMVAESLKDVDTDVDSADENDPNLLSELGELTGAAPEESSPPEEKEEVFIPTSTAVNVQEIIKQRIEMYTIAEKNAKDAGDSMKARRFGRGLKTLKDLQKSANTGKNIPLDDIPPEVSVKPLVKPSSGEGDNPPPTTPSRAAPAPPPAKETPQSPPPAAPANQSAIDALNERKDEYKKAALTAKKSGDTASALKLVRIIKQFDVVIKAVQDGQEVDLNEMPPHPWDLDLNTLVDAPCAAQETPQNPPAQKEEAETQKKIEEAPAEEALIMAETVEEALRQRLEKYKSVEAAAKDEGNSSKARRFGRIVKQYEDALKAYKAGRTVPYDELPTPPGFGPIPTGGGGGGGGGAVPKKPEPKQSEEEEKPTPAPRPRPPLRKQESARVSGNLMNTSVMDKQVAELRRRQKEFKDAAIAAKKAGEIDQAKEYLKMFKGFEKLIEIASGGFPVDMATLPIPPGQRSALEDSFAFVTQDDCQENDVSDLKDIYKRLEDQLEHQLSMCRVTREHHKNMGDVAGTNRFENLALLVRKDLDVIRLAHRKQLEVPKFHYEQKSFNIVMCNTDLTDNEVEITVVRGINYNVPNPKDVDTYVKLEFPYPQDDHTKSKTPLVKNSDNPDYDYKFKVEIVRNNKQCQRLFKRHSLKLEVYADRGFFRSDQLIGTVNVKLQPLETSCEIHDSFDLMDGRKKVGGKLEVHIRVRNPIVTKEVKKIDEKWLVIDT